eukprot:SAG11_NODE_982_length_6308_cov_504.932356_4_plen_211_part_00
MAGKVINHPGEQLPVDQAGGMAPSDDMDELADQMSGNSLDDLSDIEIKKRRTWFCDLIDAAEEEPKNLIQQKYGDVEKFMSNIGIRGPVGTTVAIKFPSKPFFRFYTSDDVVITDEFDEHEDVIEVYVFNESTEQWEQESSDEDEEEKKDVFVHGVKYIQKGVNIYCPDTDEIVWKKNPDGKGTCVNKEIHAKKEQELEAKEKKKKKKVS